MVRKVHFLSRNFGERLRQCDLGMEPFYFRCGGSRDSISTDSRLAQNRFACTMTRSALYVLCAASIKFSRSCVMIIGIDRVAQDFQNVNETAGRVANPS
jgi:hypothetical protein